MGTVEKARPRRHWRHSIFSVINLRTKVYPFVLSSLGGSGENAGTSIADDKCWILRERSALSS
jgi:hypothetical protein